MSVTCHGRGCSKHKCAGMSSGNSYTSTATHAHHMNVAAPYYERVKCLCRSMLEVNHLSRITELKTFPTVHVMLMCSQIAISSKCSITSITRVWTLTTMYAFMYFQATSSNK